MSSANPSVVNSETSLNVESFPEPEVVPVVVNGLPAEETVPTRQQFGILKAVQEKMKDADLVEPLSKTLVNGSDFPHAARPTPRLSPIMTSTAMKPKKLKKKRRKDTDAIPMVDFDNSTVNTEGIENTAYDNTSDVWRKYIDVFVSLHYTNVHILSLFYM